MFIFLCDYSNVCRDMCVLLLLPIFPVFIFIADLTLSQNVYVGIWNLTIRVFSRNKPGVTPVLDVFTTSFLCPIFTFPFHK